MRTTLLSWLVTFIFIFGLNGLFHTFVAAKLYDPNLNGIMLPMAQANPFIVAIVDVVLVAVMAYFILRTDAPALNQPEAAKAGGALGLVAAGTYNLINLALVPVWPVGATVVDMVWHIALGATGGMLLARVHQKMRGKL